MYQFFNVRCYTTNSLSELKNILARLVNALTKVLNEASVLPRIILIIPDDDIVNNINYFRFGADFVLRPVLQWIVNNIERAVQCKKMELVNILPGAVASGEPKIIWLQMMDKPNGYDRSLALRPKFNKMLESILANKQHHYIALYMKWVSILSKMYTL